MIKERKSVGHRIFQKDAIQFAMKFKKSKFLLFEVSSSNIWSKYLVLDPHSIRHQDGNISLCLSLCQSCKVSVITCKMFLVD